MNVSVLRTHMIAGQEYTLSWPVDCTVRHVHKLLKSMPMIDKAVEAVGGGKRASRIWAVDGGAHVGLWSVALAARFSMVLAFEPVQALVELWKENTRRLPATKWPEIVACALGSKDGRASFEPGKDSLAGHLKPGTTEGTFEVTTLDTAMNGALLRAPVALIKLDLEGMEVEALRGGVALLAKCKPVLIVEDKGYTSRYGSTPLLTYLNEIGYTVTYRHGPDVLCTPKR